MKGMLSKPAHLKQRAIRAGSVQDRHWEYNSQEALR
jgi:hypothetical protein